MKNRIEVTGGISEQEFEKLKEKSKYVESLEGQELNDYMNITTEGMLNFVIFERGIDLESCHSVLTVAMLVVEERIKEELGKTGLAKCKQISEKIINSRK